MIKQKFKGIYTDGRRIYTKNLAPGNNPFDDRLLREKGAEYRQIDPGKSKLAAALTNGASQIGVKPGDIVLYLGASHGYTPSFVSDITGDEIDDNEMKSRDDNRGSRIQGGFVFALDFAPRVVRDLVFVCAKRRNMAPIMADASQPETYAHQLLQPDFIYQDIAQRDQAEIFIRNCSVFLRKGGFAFLAVKSRSIDISRKPKKIFREVRGKLEGSGVLTVVDYRELDPFQKDHCVFVCKKE
ncbi:MAG: fibrillarin-like rRNA/tRNA 2'-O-methyltransferase [Candidatus Woesearchaeota archaeon]